jgi:hypothetical protein
MKTLRNLQFRATKFSEYFFLIKLDDDKNFVDQD